MAAFTRGTIPAGSPQDAFFQALRNSLTTNGWAEYDVLLDSSGNRDIVFRGQPLDATADNRCFLRLTSSTTFTARMYIDWLLDTHAGIKETGTPVSMSSSTQIKYWMRSNGYAIAWAYLQDGVYYKGYGGFTRRGISSGRRGVTKTTSSYSAGVSTVNVASDMTSSLQPGQKVLICNYAHTSGANQGSVELMTIQSVASGSITFTSPLDFSYDSGAVIGQNPLPATVTPTFSADTWGSTTSMSHDGVVASSVVVVDLLTLVGESANDPGDLNLEYGCGTTSCFINAANRSSFHGYLYHWEVFANGVQAKEDTLYDGVGSYLILMLVGTSSVVAMGPT
jgi:hypothetical protein